MAKEVQTCINSNYEKYKNIVDPKDLPEHKVDDDWAKRNFKIREFYLLKDEDLDEFVATASYQNLKNFAYIGYFYVKNGFQGKGYGKTLMKFIEDRTKMDNIHDLRLFAQPKATWAMKFYEKLGFRIFANSKRKILGIDNGIMKPFYEEGAWMLRKILE
ncbi:MAG: GNAT family N-acetyltransferase [Promethearchaeota archaeon]